MRVNQKYAYLLNLIARLLALSTGKRSDRKNVPSTMVSRSQWAVVVREVGHDMARNGFAPSRLKYLKISNFYSVPIERFAQYAARLWEQSEITDSGRGIRKITKSFPADLQTGLTESRPKPSPEATSALVDIFYATNRSKGSGPGVNERYGVESRNELSYGVSTVSIPHNHERGEFERPSIFRFEFSENARKHIMLRRVEEAGKDDFFDRVRQKRKEVANGLVGTTVVFVHGYNVSFAEGARRCAQISYDMFLRTKQRNEAVLSCVPILFSWPSRGSALPYLHDGTNAEVSAALFQDFLINLAKRTGATDIVVLAHSMGSRPVIAALERIGIGNMLGPKDRLREMILAAPDFDRNLFLNAAREVMRAVSRVTLYASGADKALAASKKLNGGARLGDADGGICTMKGMDSIDATSAGNDIFGHSNFATSKVMLDIYDIIVNRKTTSERSFSLLPVGDPPSYWQIKP